MDFTVTAHTVRLPFHDMAITESFYQTFTYKLHTGTRGHTHTHTHTNASLRYALVSLSPYYIMRLNQSWMDYLSSSFDAKSYPIQTALSLFFPLCRPVTSSLSGAATNTHTMYKCTKISSAECNWIIHSRKIYNKHSLWAETNVLFSTVQELRDGS